MKSADAQNWEVKNIFCLIMSAKIVHNLSFLVKKTKMTHYTAKMMIHSNSGDQKNILST